MGQVTGPLVALVVTAVAAVVAVLVWVACAG